MTKKYYSSSEVRNILNIGYEKLKHIMIHLDNIKKFNGKYYYTRDNINTLKEILNNKVRKKRNENKKQILKEFDKNVYYDLTVLGIRL